MACTDCNNNSPVTFDIQSFLNPGCSSCGDVACYTAAGICYKGANLTCSGIETEDTLEEALQKIDTRLCSVYGDYSTYQMNCLPTAFGADIEDEGTFVDAITDYVCTNKALYDTFVGTTFPAYQANITSQFTAITSPALTCASASITSVDTLQTVYGKYCTKFAAIDAAISLAGIDFSTCFTVTTPPTTVRQGFTELIAQICAVKSSGGSGSLPTFNNVGSCLPGSLTSTDTLVDTVGKIKTKLCGLPTWDYTHLTWGCVGAPASPYSLEGGIQKILTAVNYMLPKTVTFGSGFSVAPTDGADTCKGVTVSLGSITDRYVGANSSDGTPSYLINKLQGVGLTIDDTTNAGKVTITNPNTVKANTTDDAPATLIQKLTGSTSNGITITPTYNATTKKVDLVLTVDPSTICALLGSCADNVPCSSYTITPSGTSSVTYRNCSNNEVVISSISGPTTICAKINSVYAPNATIVNIGECTDPATPVGSLLVINEGTSTVVEDVTDGTSEFYSKTSGDYPLISDHYLIGAGTNTENSVDVDITYSGSGTVYVALFKNNVYIDSAAVTATGVYTLGTTSFTGTDAVKVLVSNTDPTPAP